MYHLFGENNGVVCDDHEFPIHFKTEREAINKNPEVRWRLEELGGGVLARRPPKTKPHGSAARPALSEVTV
jgi:hypothetical protein